MGTEESSLQGINWFNQASAQGRALGTVLLSGGLLSLCTCTPEYCNQEDKGVLAIDIRLSRTLPPTVD